MYYYCWGRRTDSWAVGRAPADLSRRAWLSLRRAGFGSLEALAAVDRGQIQGVRGFGPKTIAEIEHALAARGLVLAELATHGHREPANEPRAVNSLKPCASARERLRDAFEKRWPDGRLPFGAITTVANEQGSSKQRVHQLVHELGWVIVRWGRRAPRGANTPTKSRSGPPPLRG